MKIADTMFKKLQHVGYLNSKIKQNISCMQ